MERWLLDVHLWLRRVFNGMESIVITFLSEIELPICLVTRHLYDTYLTICRLPQPHQERSIRHCDACFIAF